MNLFIYKLKNSIKGINRRVYIAIFMIFVTVLTSIVADKFIIKKDVNNMKQFDGYSFVTETYPIFKEVVFIGDSYSHNIANELGFDTTIYSSPGLTLKELGYCFSSAKKNQKKYMVIFIGPNDFRYNTEIDEFYETLNDYVNMFVKDSQVILCSYLPSLFTFDTEKSGKSKYRIDDYDAAIRKLANSNVKVHYFDLTSLAGDRQYDKYIDDKTDKIHFNHSFYVKYINMLREFLETIK